MCHTICIPNEQPLCPWHKRDLKSGRSAAAMTALQRILPGSGIATALLNTSLDAHIFAMNLSGEITTTFIARIGNYPNIYWNSL